MNLQSIYFCFLVSAIFCLSLSAQTTAEREKITASYNQEKIETLKSNIKARNLDREARIEAYLKAHTIAKTFKSKGKSLLLYDIIDGKPLYLTTHNVNSSKATKTDRLNTGGSMGINVNGENMILAVWDEEDVRATHQEFKDDQTPSQSRVTFPEIIGISRPASNHATHVAGTLIAKGIEPNAKGMAPKASLRSYDWTLDDSEALNEAANGLLISNHSYGPQLFDDNGNLTTSASFLGAYSSDAKTWDDVAFQSPYYLMVTSAGNDGEETYVGGIANGYDKLGGNKNAKNNLVVASANPVLNATTGNLVLYPISTFSSQGPTDDFRIKPDITGDGTSVYSTGVTSDSDYFTISGTSMASPNVAGSLILLQQYYNQLNNNYMKAATLKGLVCHTALDDASRVGPDPKFGWGLLNTEAAATLIQDNTNGIGLIRELNLNNGDTFTYNFSKVDSSPIQATICWTDPSGTVQSNQLNNSTPRLVNDLDIRIQSEDTSLYYPWMLDASNISGNAIKGDNLVDNIEKVQINNAPAGNYTITVTHKGQLVNGQQNFSLILSGSNLTLNNNNNTLDITGIWPNPVNNKLHLNFNVNEETSIINLYNLEGRLVYSKTLNSPTSNINHTINTSIFTPGVYILNIKNGVSFFTKKIIIL